MGAAITLTTTLRDERARLLRLLQENGEALKHATLLSYEIAMEAGRDLWVS
jgi:hypothetical protein